MRRCVVAALAALVLASVAAAQTQGDFEYWDADSDGDLTCAEAYGTGGTGGLKLPAYEDDRNGTALIFDWLQRQSSSSGNTPGSACTASRWNNPNGYVPSESTTPTPTVRGCPAGAPTWMGLPVCEESERVGYDRDAFGTPYSSLEDEIIDDLPKSNGQVYTPYTCTLYEIEADGTAATDIEHIVALAEAYDSGLPEDQFRAFAGDLDNLTIAAPAVNRNQKSDRDAGEWGPPENRGWFASRIVAVKQEYRLSVNTAERDTLVDMLASDASREVTCAATEGPEDPEEPHEPEDPEEPHEPEDPEEPHEPEPTPILPAAGLVVFGLGLMLAGRRALRRMRH